MNMMQMQMNSQPQLSSSSSVATASTSGCGSGTPELTHISQIVCSENVPILLECFQHIQDLQSKGEYMNPGLEQSSIPSALGSIQTASEPTWRDSGKKSPGDCADVDTAGNSSDSSSKVYVSAKANVDDFSEAIDHVAAGGTIEVSLNRGNINSDNGNGNCDGALKAIMKKPLLGHLRINRVISRDTVGKAANASNVSSSASGVVALMNTSNVAQSAVSSASTTASSCCKRRRCTNPLTVDTVDESNFQFSTSQCPLQNISKFKHAGCPIANATMNAAATVLSALSYLPNVLGGNGNKCEEKALAYVQEKEQLMNPTSSSAYASMPLESLPLDQLTALHEATDKKIPALGTHTSSRSDSIISISGSGYVTDSIGTEICTGIGMKDEFICILRPCINTNAPSSVFICHQKGANDKCNGISHSHNQSSDAMEEDNVDLM